MLWTLHHIASDGWSNDVFFREFGTLYEASHTDAGSVPPLPVQYTDTAIWQRAWLQSDAHAEGLRYWTAQLAGATDRAGLLTDRPRPETPSFDAGTCQAWLTVEQSDAIRRLASAHGATLYMTLLAAFGLLSPATPETTPSSSAPRSRTVRSRSSKA